MTKFDYFYGGHAELENVGFSGIPVDDRRESNEILSSVFDEAKSIAQIMDSKGFDTLWLAEHHFQSEGHGCIPNIPMLCVYLSQVTEKLRFGSFFNVVPAWNPIRLAEDFAAADVMTGSRVSFGFGRGYIAREVETLGAPLNDDSANRDLFEEQVEIILKAWNEESFSYKGKYYDIPANTVHRGKLLEEITLVPRPLKLPVECWQPMAGGSQRGMDFMAKNGIKGVIAGGTAPGGSAEDTALRWQETLKRSGRDVAIGDDLAIVVQIHIADSEEKAILEAEPFFQEQLKALAPLGRFPTLTEDQIQATYDPSLALTVGLPTLKDAVNDGSWLCGPPDDIAEKIGDLLDRFPNIERISVGAGALGIPPSVIRDDISWFGDEILPKFNEKRRGAVV